MLGPSLAQHDRRSRGRGDRRTDHAARRHQRVGVAEQRHDRKIHPFEARRGALEVAVIDGEHHRVVSRGPKDPREATLHSPVERPGPFERVAQRGGRNRRPKPLTNFGQ